MSIRDYSVSVRSIAVAAAFGVTSLASAYAADMGVMPVKAPPPAQPFFLVNDTSVSFTWYPDSTDPGVINAKNNYRLQGDITHFDVWAYGTNFVDLNFQQYGKKDPTQSMGGASGAEEADALVRSTISGNAIFGKGTFSNFLTKDVSFGYGGLFVVVDNFLAPSTHQYDVGGVFSLNLPGTVNLGVYAQKETHHITQEAVCGIGVYAPPAGTPPGSCQFTGDQTYKWAPHLELLISEPLTFLPIPLTWNSFTGVTFPKGTGISQANLSAIAAAGTWCGPTVNNNPCSAFTKTELFEDNRLTLDVGKLAWGKAGIWEGYVGYRYWMNKFGADHNNGLMSQIAPGTAIESTAYLGTTYHFK